MARQTNSQQISTTETTLKTFNSLAAAVLAHLSGGKDASAFSLHKVIRVARGSLLKPAP